MTTGASNDIERATDTARKMVCSWGMSELGAAELWRRGKSRSLLGREIAQHRDYSESTAIRIDEQVKKLVEAGYSRAKKIIDDHHDALERIALFALWRRGSSGRREKRSADADRGQDSGAPGQQPAVGWTAAGDQAGFVTACSRHAGGRTSARVKFSPGDSARSRKWRAVFLLSDSLLPHLSIRR